MNALDATSTRPYLIRALYEWCTDNGFTPYVAVLVDDTVQVPREYVKNNEIVLNISMGATSSLKLGNDFIEFKARFGGSAREIHVPIGRVIAIYAREIHVPIGRVIAIYARENGQGMAFPGPVPSKAGSAPTDAAEVTTEAALSLAPSPSAQDGNKPFKLVPDDGPAEPPKKPAGKRPILKSVK
jgi:stringent starvation protein B